MNEEVPPVRYPRLIPALAVLFALAVLAFTLYKHVTLPEGPTSTFTPPEVEHSDAPVMPWDTGIEIVTPIA